MGDLTIDYCEELIEQDLYLAHCNLSDHEFDILLNKVFNLVVNLKNRHEEGEEE